MVIAGYHEGPVRGLVPAYEARALVGSVDGGWQGVPMGGADIDAPPGYPKVRGGGALPLQLVYGVNGFVASGRALFFDSNYAGATMVGAFWHSADGLDWQLIDPRGVVGERKPFVPWALTAVADGYVAAGLLADSTNDPSVIAVLGSADGIDWRILSTVSGTWSLAPNGLIVKGDELLLSGVEYPCTDDTRWLSTFTWAPEARLWRSTDGGATWAPVDLMLSGLVTQPEPMPQSKADCSGLSGQELNDRFRTQGGLLGVTDGVAVVSGGQDRVAVSFDLATWTQYELTGAEPTAGDRGGGGTLLWADDQGLIVIQLQNWRDPEQGRARDTGIQTQVWRLTAAGEAVKLPLGRPVLPNFGRLVAVSDSEIWLYDGTALYRSVAGPLETWGTCTPAAQADCSFVTADLFAPGADLHGIDLRATIVHDGDLTGANLSGALMGGASLFLPMDGADLTGASAVDASLGSLTGANLAGTDLTDARVDVTFFDAQRSDGAVTDKLTIAIRTDQSLEGFDFSGQDLFDWTFTGSQVGNMRDVDFSDADLTGGFFTHVDLTGANFDGAKLESIYFGLQVTCPDGQPVDSSKFGAAACRIS